MKKVTHIVQIFLDIERPSREKYALDLTEEWVKNRIGFFNKFTLPSLLNQTFQDFRIFLLCGNKHKKLTSKYKWNKRVELCYGKGRSGTITTGPGYPEPGLKVKEFLDIDTDYIAITRLDSDDMFHRDAMAHVRDNLELSEKRECLVFRKYLYWDRVNKFIYPVHHKQSPPFITHVFPKEIYQDYGEFAKQHFISHRFMSERGFESLELPPDMVCVINHEENISRVKRRLPLEVLSDEQKKRIKAEKDGSFLKKDEIASTLIPFSVNTEDVEGEAGRSERVAIQPFYDKTDIVFTTHNHADLSIESLKEIKKCTHIPYRIIWVDSGSDWKNYETIKAKVDEFDNISHRFDVNRFYAQTVNQGLTMATSRYVVALSNDVIVTDGWLRKLISLMDGDPKIGLLSPLTDKIGSSGPRAQAAIKRFGLPVNGGSPREINALPPQFGNYHGNISMFCAVVRQEVMEKIGLLDERFFILGNDDDYCDRVRLAGYKTGMCLNCFVFHEHGITKNAIFAPGTPERMAIKRHHQALLREKRRERAMTGVLN